MSRSRILFGTSALAGLAAFAAAATPVWAQDTSKQADSTEAAASEESSEVEEVIVTGSRIRRNEYTAASPIQVITSEQATLEGLVDTAELIQQSSVASGSFQVNNQLTGFVTTGGPGANTISLRGLGANRTLVLMNGRRAGPAGVRGTVGPFDLNVVPSALIERVEILKDGASSIYGSDAVAGVVNIITKSNLDGGVIEAYGNQSFEGGGEQYRVNAAYGKTFDRGYINGAVDYYKQNMLQAGDRDDTACASDYLFSAATGERVDFTDVTTGDYKCYNLFAGAVRVSANAALGLPALGDLIYKQPGIDYNVPGNNSPYADLARQARVGFPETYRYGNYDHDVYSRSTVISPVERMTLALNGGFDLTESVEAYGELIVNRRESEQWGARQFFPSLSASNPNNRFGPRPAMPIIPLKSDAAQSVDYFRGVAGLRGEFGGGFLSGWDWDLYAQYSRSDGDYSTDAIYNDRTNALTGASACNQAAITISGGQCSDLPGGVPWTSERILAGDFNDAERAFLFFTDKGNTVYEHKYVEGSIAGDLFDLPAGSVGGAFGFQVRQEKIDDQPGAGSQNSNLWGSTSAGRTKGSDSIREVFAEVDVPVLRGVPFFERLDVNLSTRWSDYDSYGENSTGKIGVNWQITPEWRIRATQGTSFRAPALYELFLANQTSFLGQTSVDPCINWQDSSDAILQQNCQAAGVPGDYTGAGTSSALIITGGGIGVLKPETATAKTLGLIWTPEFIDFSVALDYFDIEVSDEVRTFGAGNIASQCYRSSDYPSNPFCSLLVRNNDPSAPSNQHSIVQINNSYVNVAQQWNRGLDLTARYRHEFGFGDLTINGSFTWQFEDKVNLLGGSTEDTNGETTEPDFTGKVSTRFDRGPWTVFWGMDMIGKQSDAEEYGGSVFFSSRYGQDVHYKVYNEFTLYHDFSVRREFDTWTIQGGLQNAFDERPPAQSSGQFRRGTAALNMYDMIGRRVFVNVTKKF